MNPFHEHGRHSGPCRGGHPPHPADGETCDAHGHRRARLRDFFARHRRAHDHHPGHHPDRDERHGHPGRHAHHGGHEPFDPSAGPARHEPSGFHAHREHRGHPAFPPARSRHRPHAHAGHDRCEHHAGPRGRGFDFLGGTRGGRGQGDGFDDPRGRGRGARPLGHGDLRLLMLSLIAEQPRHGYELIRLIEALFHGAYSPSPGAIYPTLSQLEDMGLIAATQDEGRKRYAITEEGRQHVAAARADIDAALARTHRSARDLAKAQIPAPVREALRRIKRGLLARHGRWNDAEIARVAALLDAAADAMDGPRPD